MIGTYAQNKLSQKKKCAVVHLINKIMTLNQKKFKKKERRVGSHPSKRVAGVGHPLLLFLKFNFNYFFFKKNILFIF
jgi:hypothetical protein